MFTVLVCTCLVCMFEMFSISCNAGLQSLAPFPDCTVSHWLINTILLFFVALAHNLPRSLYGPHKCDPVKSHTQQSQQGLDQDCWVAKEWAEWSPAHLLQQIDRLSCSMCRSSTRMESQTFDTVYKEHINYKKNALANCFESLLTEAHFIALNQHLNAKWWNIKWMFFYETRCTSRPTAFSRIV